MFNTHIDLSTDESKNISPPFFTGAASRDKSAIDGLLRDLAQFRIHQRSYYHALARLKPHGNLSSSDGRGVLLVPSRLGVLLL
jgi:hypothetical protein